MAWDNGGEISRFNPAQLKMERINKISNIINDAKLNVEAMNLTFGKINFFVWYSAVQELYREVFIKFSDDERTECEKIKSKIDKIIETYPVFNKKGHADIVNMKFISKMIDYYESKVREYQDDHGLDTPNQDDDEGL